MRNSMKGVCMMKRCVMMMILGLFVAFLIGVSFQPAGAEEGKGGAAPAKQQQGPGYFFIRDDIGISVDATGSMTLHENECIKLLNKKGLEKFGQMVRIYDSSRQTIEIHLARTIEPDGKSINVPSTAIQEKALPALKESALYKNLRMKVITFPEVKPGCTVEYNVLTRNMKPYPRQAFWETSFTQDNGELDESSFFAEIPEKRKLYYFTPGYKTLVKPQVTTSGGKRTYSWSFRKVEPITEEVAMPSLQDLATKVLVSSFASWNDVGGFFNDLIKDKLTCSDEMKEKLDLLVSGEPDSEKVRKIFAWLCREKEVVDLNLSVGAFEFHNAADVFKEKTISNRDFAILLLALLREKKIDAYPVLVASPSIGKLYPEIPTIQQFDSILVCASVDGKPYWLEPLGLKGGINEINSDLQGRPALLVKGDTAEFAMTPQTTFSDNREEMRGEFRLFADNSAEGSMKFSEYGVNKLQWLKIYDAISEQDRSGIPRVLIGQINPMVIILDHSFRENLYDQGPFIIQARFKIGDFMTRSGEGFTVHLPMIASGSMKDLLSIDPGKRLWPIVVGSAFQEDRRFHIILPEGMVAKSVPRDIFVENGAGAFQVICNSNGSDIWYYSRMSIKRGVIPREDAKAFVDILNVFLSAQKENITVEKRKPL
jgi:hypothetical protein